MTTHRLSHPWRRCLAAIGCLLGLGAGLDPAQAQVGMSELTLGGLPVTMVYPTAEPARSRSIGPFTVQVAMDADPTAGRHPLVVMSHGTGGNALADHDLAAALARAGLVVAQPLHAGDNFRDTQGAGPESFARRPGEVSRVIDALAADPAWSARLELSRVGVHGMSAGGVTGLSLAGAQWRLVDLVRHCQRHLEDDAGFCLQGASEGEARSRRIAQFTGLGDASDAQLPAMLTALHGGRTPTAETADPRPDPRIAVVTLAVPVSAIFSSESLARIRIPVGLVTAAQDTVLLPRWHAERVLANCPRCTRLADLPEAGHFDLLSPWPEGVARSVAAQQVRGGLPNPAFDVQGRVKAQARIVAFQLQHLGR